MGRTRIYFTTDIHGSEVCFRKFLNAWKVYKADVCMLCGDITGKAVIPIQKENDGKYTLTFLGDNLEVSDLTKLGEIKSRIINMGYYPFIASPKDMEDLITNEKKLDEIFLGLMTERLKKWIIMADAHLKNASIKMIISPGNDDRWEIDEILRTSERVVFPEEKIIYVDRDHEMISLGYSNITPWKCPRDISEEELSKRIESLASKVENMENCIFNIHVPPYGSIIDSAPKLDEQLRPKVDTQGIVYTSVGSIAVRDAIKKYQPLLGLHGHIHESKGVCKIGRTLCINPGSEYTECLLHGVIVDIDNKKVAGHLLLTG